MKYLDPLYGQLEFDNKILKLFQTSTLTRIRDISLSAVPPITTPFGIVGSRFEHSVGVAHLASLLTTNSDFEYIRTNLFLASLFHDVGSPPFSHLSEPFLEEITGKDHEEFAEKMLFESQTQNAIKNYGGDPGVVYSLITGQFKPWSDLLNGTIDLDNIDNSLRFGLAIGAMQTQIYDPEYLIKAYQIKNNQLYLDLDFYLEIQKWELCRRIVYDIVYSDINLNSGAMLQRAFEFALESNDLDESFFDLTESQAFYLLEHKFNPITRQLVSSAKHWRYYLPAFKTIQSSNISDNFKNLCTDWKARHNLADQIAKYLHIQKQFIALIAGQNKGFKKIHLPFIGNQETRQHQPIQQASWWLRVYIHSDYQDKISDLQSYISEFLKN